MRNILITGATGNVGREVVRQLEGKNNRMLAGVRNLADAESLKSKMGVEPVYFDFTDPDCYAPALAGIERLFLLRPPQLADVRRFFEPLVYAARKSGVDHITFLSVQGADTNSFIPHHKIEKLIKDSGIKYTFLRPAYFMQNFTTNLLPDIQNKQLISLPAGKARFTLVDLRDIGAVAAHVLNNPAAHSNVAYDLTSTELLDFTSMARIISHACGRVIRYQSPKLLSFYMSKRKEGLPAAYIGVLVMLHFLPRFQQVPKVSNCIEALTGKAPISFRQFAMDHAQLFLPQPVG